MNTNELSPHLRSRLECEQILGSYGVPVSTLRAGLIIGSKGSSYPILKKLVLVSPEFDLDHEKIRPVSAGADIVINKTKVYESFDEAIENFNIIIATTNRIRSIQQKTISFSHLSNFLDNTKNKIGVVFGPERSGLDNDKIALCDYVLKIDTNTKFSSLNLSHAVNLICYDL